MPSDAAPPAAFSLDAYAAYVVSDYPAGRFGAAAMEHVAEGVKQGSGLVMLGGWESFFGRLGEYHRRRWPRCCPWSCSAATTAAIVPSPA